VIVVEAPGAARLPLEAIDEDGVGAQLRAQELDRDGPTQVTIHRVVDLRIGALAELRAEKVAVVDALALEVHRSS